MLPLFVSVSASALAADWDGETSTDWFTATNWVVNSVPVAAENVYIDTITPNPTIVSGSSSPVLGELIVGTSGTGMLTIEDGGTVSSTIGYIGSGTGSEGTVTVTGAGSTWTNSSSRVVGYSGTGTLTIEDGGAVSNTYGWIGYGSTGEGTVTVTGSGSTWTNSGDLRVGNDGNGTVTIEDGGAVSNVDASIGRYSGSEGTVTVTGAGSTWTNTGDLNVGEGGTGTLTIEDGGTVSNTEGRVGDQAGSEGTVTVTGAGSMWTNSGDLYVGNIGTGTLTIADGATVINNNGYIGTYLGVGTVTVSGPGSTWTNNGELTVGKEGSGTLIIENGAKVVSNISSIGWIGHHQESTVTVTGAGSEWTVGGADSLSIGGSSNGTLIIEDGGSVSTNRAFIGSGDGGGFQGTAIVTGEGSTWTNNDYIVIGYTNHGMLTIADGGVVSTGKIIMTWAPDGPDWGWLNIGAAAGDAPAAPGTLDASSVEFAYGTGMLVFNHTDETGTYEFAPELTPPAPGGRQTIEHYAGFTRLTSNSSGFTKNTNIYGGTLAIENMLGGTVNVMSGGTLGGSGTANGDVNFNNGSYYLVEMDGTTSPQGLTVQGTATLDGTMMLAGDYASIAGMGNVVILTTDTALATTFDGVTASSIFLTPTLAYEMDGGPDYVFVSVEQTTDFADVAQTRNQMAVGGALDTLLPGNPLYAAVALLGSEDAARNAYDQLSGEAQASLKGALVENGQRTVDAVNDRLHNAFDDINSNSSVAAYGDTVDTAGGFWLTGYGDWMNTDATNNTHEMSSDLYGVVAGLDYRVGEVGRLGILGGYSRTDTSVDALASEADADSYTIGVYGGADNGNAVLSLGALYTWHSIDSSRTVTNPVTERLSADYDARSYQFFAEAGYRATMDNVTVEPFAGVSYMNLKTDAFRETGGIAALSSPSQTTSTTFTTLGLRSSIALASNVSTRGMVGWRHAFGDVDPASTFTIAGSGPFTILGAPIAQDAAVVEAGIDIEASDNVTIGASYEGQYGDGAIANGFNARLLAEF